MVFSSHRSRSEHTSELQSRGHLVCRLLLEKKKRESTRGDRLAAESCRLNHPGSRSREPSLSAGCRNSGFPLKGGPVDYGLYVDGAVAGAVEAKKEGWTLI